MKNTFVTVLQQRMIHMMTEQFWAVAVITGLNVMVIIQKETILKSLPEWSVVAAVFVLTVYGVGYILHRPGRRFLRNGPRLYGHCRCSLEGGLRRLEGPRRI